MQTKETKHIAYAVRPLIHKGTARLETARLVLRPFTPADAEPMYRNWATEEAVTRFLTWKPHASPEQTAWLAEKWAEQGTQPEFYQWAIELKALGEPIGSLTVVRRDELAAAAELGYCIGSHWWGQGLMTEAVRAVIGYLIREVGFHRVSACHDVENPASGRVMEKSCMVREGTLRAFLRNNRGVVDVTFYSVLAEEWNG